MGGFSLIHSCWRVHRSPGLFLCFGGWGGLGGGGGWGGWVGGRNNVPFAAFAWTFFLLPIFMLRLQAAASSCTQHVVLRNTSCYAFGRKCYVTLARCRIILHATRHATLAGCRIILHATRRATLLVASVMLRLHAAASSCTQHVMLRLHAAASSLRNTSCYAFGRKCYVTLARCRIIWHATRHATLARCCIIFTQHVVLRCCWGGVGGGWGGVGVGGGGWGGRNNVPFAAFAWTFFLLPIFMLRLQAAASSCTQHVVLRFWSQVLCYACRLPHHLARNTSCYACTLLHHLYATRRATLLVASVMLRLHAAASSCTQHVMLRLHAAASSLRNTSCYAVAGGGEWGWGGGGGWGGVGGGASLRSVFCVR